MDGQYNQRIRQLQENARQQLIDRRPPPYLRMTPPYREASGYVGDRWTWQQLHAIEHDPVRYDDLARNRPQWPA